MRKYRAISILFLIALLAVSCSKAVTVYIVNRSGADIDIEDHGKLLHCASGQMVSFTPERVDNHDIAIQMQNETLLYSFAGIATPNSFLDIDRGARPCCWFVFEQDHKLYILKPSKEPLNEDVGIQPPNYPLNPLKTN